MASEVLLEHQLAMAGDDHGMHVGLGGLQPRGDAAQACAIEADALRGSRSSSHRQGRSGYAADEIALARSRN